MNSTASVAHEMPPMPSSGTSTALRTSHIMRSATGFTAGPDRPPTPRASTGRRRSASMAMPSSVLMSESASAPAATAARAISVTLGVSFTMSGRFVAARQRDTTASTLSVHVPMVMPPASTFGHEMFTS